MKRSQPKEITALKVKQWLKEWEKVNFDEDAHRRRPDLHFYLFTLAASDLKALSGIQRRTTEGGLLRSKDLGIQRRHDKDRSEEIHKFIRYGYPWSELSEAKRKSGQFDDLRKPGWLPTAIVINILKPGDERRGGKISERDIITIKDSGGQTAILKLPDQFSSSTWKPGTWHPIEVIDGQHRLWAFEEGKSEGDFELPVVAFHGLDISWQAYLFWTINIKPKRINASLAFDLYPLLRTEDWLEKFEGHSIYRETRAQELTEALWAHPESPWHQRINMLGESGLKQTMVSQAAWIRALTATIVKAYEGKRVSIGGLFGAPVGSHKEVLPWSRAQQAAFLIFAGQKIRDAIIKCKEPWAKSLRQTKEQMTFENEQDPAFAGPNTLLNTDQGIRGILHITNDLCYVRAKELDLENWVTENDAGAADEEMVNKALKSLRKQEKLNKFLDRLADGLIKFDWRSSSAEGLSENLRTSKLVFRGSGGYKELRRQLLKLLEKERGDIGTAAQEVNEALGY
ncbi:DGQHR domain-containing protein [bacterium]|nr:DGQHR domain-containing protein [bacterium]RIK74050.1 MAG: hypothetical protein DCC62_16035 [candidate division KSB1 bacterium]